jgi:hypothetical protein
VDLDQKETKIDSLTDAPFDIFVSVVPSVPVPSCLSVYVHTRPHGDENIVKEGKYTLLHF